MLVVLASCHDKSCQELVAGWAADARLLTCKDLSVRGWRYHPGGEMGTSVISGRLTEAHEIDGVLTRMSAVSESELGNIFPGDRSYAAAEMTAFLAAWLTELRCPILNHPAPACLMGPPWRREKWAHAAAKLGIPTVPAYRSVSSITDYALGGLAPGGTTVNVVGRCCFGNADKSLLRSAMTLAEAAGVDLLRARFASGEKGSAFIGADYWVDVNDPEISAAILRHFLRQRMP